MKTSREIWAQYSPLWECIPGSCVVCTNGSLSPLAARLCVHRRSLTPWDAAIDRMQWFTEPIAAVSSGSLTMLCGLFGWDIIEC